MKCRVCKSEVCDHSSFCPFCGARRGGSNDATKPDRNLLKGIGNWVRGLARDDLDNRFDEACELARFGFGAAIDKVERVARLDIHRPRFRSILAIFYRGAADERIGLHSFGGPLRALESKFSLLYGAQENQKAKQILDCISDSSDVYSNELDDALDGSLELYDKSIALAADDPDSYRSRARAFHELGDRLLMAYFVFPDYQASPIGGNEEKIWIQGNITFGVDLQPSRDKPDDLARNVIRVYSWAQNDYAKAIELDPADADAYFNLSVVQRRQGKSVEADYNRGKALELLNKAIQADSSDSESYLKRAEIFEVTDLFRNALADYEKFLTLSTHGIQLSNVKDKIERVRKHLQ